MAPTFLKRTVFAALCFAAGVANLIGDDQAAGPKRPKIDIHLNKNERYHHGSDIAFTGIVSPPVDSQVEVTAYAVRADGGLVPVGRAKATPDQNGDFGCTLYATSPGWRPGTLRVVARLGIMPHLKAERDVGFVDPGKPLTDWVIYEKPSSGVVIDLAAPPKFVQVPRDERFLVRWVTDPAAPGGGQLWRIVRDDGVTTDTAFVAWLRDGNKGWTEHEFVLSKEGVYELFLDPQGGAGPPVRSVKIIVGTSLASLPSSLREGG